MLGGVAILRRSGVLAVVLAACAEPPAPRSTANDAPAQIGAPSLPMDSEPAPRFGAVVPQPDEPPHPPDATQEPVAPSPVESPPQAASRTGTEPTPSAGAPANRELLKIGAKSERVKIATKPERAKIATKPERAKIGSMTGRVKVRSKVDHEVGPRVKINAKPGRVKLDTKRDRVKIGSKRDRERIGSKPQTATPPAELGVAPPDAAPATNPGTGSTGSESPRATPEEK